ncbi:MAG: hypothetical protein K2R98_16125 [Gemmataceae bacterium]|nr:hypothetical protein [Gemmataceae bacterium]
MKKLYLVALVGLAALGLDAGRASAAGWFCHGCCGGCHTLKFCCVQPNAFSPFCCSPAPKCGHCLGAPVCFGGACSMPCGPTCGAPYAGGCGYGGGYGYGGYDAGYGGYAPPAGMPSGTMPPASGGNYTPPMPMPAADGQGRAPMYNYPMARPMVMPTGYPMMQNPNMMMSYPMPSGQPMMPMNGQGMYFGNMLGRN